MADEGEEPEVEGEEPEVEVEEPEVEGEEPEVEGVEPEEEGVGLEGSSSLPLQENNTRRTHAQILQAHVMLTCECSHYTMSHCSSITSFLFIWTEYQTIGYHNDYAG